MPWLEERDGKWQVRWRSHARQYSQLQPTQTAAQRFFEMKTLELAYEKSLASTLLSSFPFAEALDLWLGSIPVRQEHTRQGYRRQVAVLRQHFQDQNLSQITPLDLDRFLSRRIRQIRSWSYYHQTCLLKRFFI